MELRQTEQLEKQDLENIEFDLILMSSGYESRGRYLAEIIDLKGKQKFVLSFDNHNNAQDRIINDKLFKMLGYEVVQSSGNSEDRVIEILESLNFYKESNINILVDYTSMTRVWYAAILKYFNYKINNFSSVSVYFSYSCSIFIDPPTTPVYNRYVGPIDGFCTFSVPSKPTAVIIGLGYVENRAYGLAEYFDVDPFLFITDSSSNLDFHYEVLLRNDKLIKDIGPNNLYQYPLKNMIFTETLLYHFCSDLLKSYRVVIAPCGPKPFTLIALLMYIRTANLDVWRISAGEEDIPLNKHPNGEILVYKVVFV